VALDGLFVIDKPAGPTSHDVVQSVRKALGMRRVGHGGTLDPDATGVLLVAAGQATRFFPFLSRENKVYEGRIRLGFATDTYDASGRPITEVSPDLPGRADLAAAMKAFEGEILQTPPRYSAKKIAGKPVYKMARADKEFDLEPVRITVQRFVLRDYLPPDLDFEAACSAGTYIRALAHDLGRRLGCGAHLVTLRRTSVGPYGLADAVPLAEFEDAAAGDEEARFMVPLERLLPWAPAVTVRPEAEALVRNGRSLEPSDLETPFPDFGRPDAREALARLLSPGGKLIALARPTPDGSSLHPFLVIA
jgi:tRNA pseudouridine55 synthase